MSFLSCLEQKMMLYEVILDYTGVLSTYRTENYSVHEVMKIIVQSQIIFVEKLYYI